MGGMTSRGTPVATSAVPGDDVANAQDLAPGNADAAPASPTSFDEFLNMFQQDAAAPAVAMDPGEAVPIEVPALESAAPPFPPPRAVLAVPALIFPAPSLCCRQPPSAADFRPWGGRECSTIWWAARRAWEAAPRRSWKSSRRKSTVAANKGSCGLRTGGKGSTAIRSSSLRQFPACWHRR